MIKNMHRKALRKITSIFTLLLLNFMYLPVLVSAQGSGGSTGGGVSFPNPLDQDSIVGLVEDVLEIVVQFGAVISVLFLVVAGFMFVTAQGNEGQLSKAKTTFFWTIVGAMIVLGAFVLGRVIRETASSLGANTNF